MSTPPNLSCVMNRHEGPGCWSIALRGVYQGALPIIGTTTHPAICSRIDACSEEHAAVGADYFAIERGVGGRGDEYNY